MRLKLVCAAVLLILSAIPLAAEQPEQKKPEIDPAVMKAVMDAATPGEAHKKLAAFIGRWDAKVTSWMAPGAEPMTSTGTSESRWILGGRYIEQRFNGTFADTPFEGAGIMGYDNVRKQYFGTWVDSMSTGMMLSTGVLGADGKWKYTGSYADPITGKDQPVEETVTIIDENHHKMEMFGPGPDGKMFKNMEIEYTRKK